MPFTLLLLAFFVPSVALSRIGHTRKHGLVDIGKGGPRDAAQVLANGGAATACAILAALGADPRWRWAFAGGYAAATADTWATEIGTLAEGRPRSILTLRPVATGLSGGITAAGTAGELAGAAWIALCATRALGGSTARGGAVLAGGLAGATADSLFGATLQELRYCDACMRACETDPHACGAATRRIRGLPGVSNDVVNLLATASGALVTFALA